MSPLSKTRDSADHAGHSLLLVVLKLHTSTRLEPSSLSQNNNSLIAPRSSMDLSVAVVDRWTVPTDTGKTETLLNSNPHTPILPKTAPVLTMPLLEKPRSPHTLMSNQTHGPLYKLLPTLDQSLLPSKPTNLSSKDTLQVSLLTTESAELDLTTESQSLDTAPLEPKPMSLSRTHGAHLGEKMDMSDLKSLAQLLEELAECSCNHLTLLSEDPNIT